MNNHPTALADLLKSSGLRKARFPSDRGMIVSFKLSLQIP
jgi:hypothetical protein